MASEAKKPKIEENGLPLENGISGKQEVLKNFGNFQVTQILSESSEKKSICVEGKFSGDRRSVVVLERLPLRAEILPNILSESTKLRPELVNDIYGQYECLINGDESGAHSLKANVILPATQKHVDKYTESPSHVILETPQLFHFVTQPFIDSERFHIDWVYNILEHKKESERIIYEDPDPDTGFIILPDFKWSGKQMTDLYLIGIVHNRTLRSLRSLRYQHLTLLRKMLKDGIEAIAARYGVQKSQIRAYFHYQPSYYHLHVHYTHVQYNAPGSNVDKAHLLPVVIHNIEGDPFYYSKALLPFSVKESSNLYKAYKDTGYFDLVGMKMSDTRYLPFDFIRHLGQAKHEPCGEHWSISYGDSAWRMAIASLCLKNPADKLTVAKIALTSAFTCLGQTTDQSSVSMNKINEVRESLAKVLPLDVSAKFYHLFLQHVSCRRKACINSECHKTYRNIMELEEALLLLEELQKEGSDTKEMQNLLVKKISEMNFDGVESQESVVALLTFFLRISSLLHLKRTGWVRCQVRDPERVSGHMFRMGIMAMLLEDDEHPNSKVEDVTDSAMVISLVHDMAECIVGDITPSDPVSPEEKHKMEVEAMDQLVTGLPKSLANMFKKAFNRYEAADPHDNAALLTKDLDKFDMVAQAFEYELKEKRVGDLNDFFASTSGPDYFKHPVISRWNSEIRSLRQSELSLKKQKNLQHFAEPVKAGGNDGGC